MEFGAIILCRLDSTRLPGKTLMEAGGKPLLWHVISRCRQVSVLRQSVVVATSDRSIDDPIAAYCRRQNLFCYRGRLDDVAHRALSCARACEFDYFFRVNADSPFVDPGLLGAAAEAASGESLDFVTNLKPRTYPYGVSAELLRTTTFESAYRQFSQPGHFEHMTQYYYENLDRFRWRNLLNPAPADPHTRLTIDTPEDFDRFRDVLAATAQHGRFAPFADAMELKAA